MRINIAIIGGGVAGLSASIYALRANATVTLYEQSVIGGLTATIDKIENYPTYTSIDGYTLVDNIYQQAMALGLVVKYQQVVSVNNAEQGIEVTTTKGTVIYDSVVVATGTHHNKLGIAVEESYLGKGVSYCATCDGNFFKGKVVTIVGSVNSTVKEALYLAGLASKVILISPNDSLTGDSLAIAQLQGSDNVEIYYNSMVTDIGGDNKVEYVNVSNIVSNSTTKVDCSAVFVAIGSKPASQLLASAGVDTKNGFVIADDSMMTNVEGIFVAGDVYNGKLKQIVTACGDGATAGNYAVIYARTHQRTKE